MSEHIYLWLLKCSNTRVLLRGCENLRTFRIFVVAKLLVFRVKVLVFVVCKLAKCYLMLVDVVNA